MILNSTKASIALSMFLAAISFDGCKKPDLSDPHDTIVLDPTDSTFIEGNCMFPTLIESENKFYYPTFDPQNDSKIAFSHSDGLYVFNVSTNSLMKISDKRLISEMTWTNDNHILFSDFQINSISPDGSEYKRISPYSSDKITFEYPNANLFNDSYIYSKIGHFSLFDYQNDPRLYQVSKLYLHTIEKGLDSICIETNSEGCIVGSIDWISESEFVYAHGNQSDDLIFSKYDLKTNLSKELLRVSDYSFYADHAYINSSKQLVYSLVKKGIFAFSTQTGELNQVIESSDSLNYAEFSINASESKMICRKQKTIVKQCTTLVSNSLIQFNLSDFSEKTILE